ncbi:uncharacterized protein TNCV_3830181 [Trichonephila clavipes]|nr:uncharacterized protein TNCV_3830181 [Trichonephila clavipes]
MFIPSNVTMSCRLGDVVGLSLTFCTQGCGFDLGSSRWIFLMQKINSGHVVCFYGMYRSLGCPFGLDALSKIKFLSTNFVSAELRCPSPLKKKLGFKITRGNSYHLNGAPLKSDTSSWRCTRSAKVEIPIRSPITEKKSHNEPISTEKRFYEENLLRTTCILKFFGIYRERLEDNYYEFSVLEEFVEDVEYENFTNSKDLADLALEKIESYLTSINSKLQFEENKSKVNAYSNINLPKYDLPQFAGDFNSWLSFKSIFSSSIDSNESLTDIQKLQYLQNAVTLDASRLIKGFAITHENYKQAWETLLNRYDNQRIGIFPMQKVLLSKKC